MKELNEKKLKERAEMDKEKEIQRRAASKQEAE